MNELESSKLLIGLIEGTPENASNWFQSIKNQEIVAPKDFNWTLFVSETTTTAHRAANQNKKELSLDWAELSIELYPFVSEQFTEGSIKFSNECSEMYLRAGLINKFGIDETHKILNPKIIIDWFFNNLEMSLDEAKNEQIKWNAFTHAEKVNFIKTSKTAWFTVNIRNRLNVIKLLYDNGNLKLDTELEKWLEYRKNLTL